MELQKITGNYKKFSESCITEKITTEIKNSKDPIYQWLDIIGGGISHLKDSSRKYEI